MIQYLNRLFGKGKNDEGFTLIEIVAVLVVLAIMAAIVIAKTVDIRTAAVDGKCAEIVGALNDMAKSHFAERMLNGQSVSCTNQWTGLHPLVNGGFKTALENSSAFEIAAVTALSATPITITEPDTTERALSHGCVDGQPFYFYQQ